MNAQLAKMEGTYDVSVKSWEAPGAPPTIEKGTATREMINGHGIVERIDATLYGQPWQCDGMRGYDCVSGQHSANWNDSKSSLLMSRYWWI